MGIEISQDLWREVESGRGGSYRPFNFGIDSLIGGFVALLSLTVEIRRDGQLSHDIDNLSKTEIARPLEIYTMRGAVEFSTGGTDNNGLTMDFNLTPQGSFFPLLQISHQAVPSTVVCGLEHQLIV